MQEEVNEKTIALSFRSARLTGEVLKKAMVGFISQMEKRQGNKQKTLPQGKQRMEDLMKQNSQLSNIEVTDGNIKSFEKVARKYHVDFSVKKDNTLDPPKYIVFFKAKDVDVMTQAFKEYSANELKKTDRPSLKKRLTKALDVVHKHREKEKVKGKDLGQSL